MRGRCSPARAARRRPVQHEQAAGHAQGSSQQRSSGWDPCKAAKVTAPATCKQHSTLSLTELLHLPLHRHKLLFAHAVSLAAQHAAGCAARPPPPLAAWLAAWAAAGDHRCLGGHEALALQPQPLGLAVRQWVLRRARHAAGTPCGPRPSLAARLAASRAAGPRALAAAVENVLHEVGRRRVVVVAAAA